MSFCNLWLSDIDTVKTFHFSGWHFPSAPLKILSCCICLQIQFFFYAFWLWLQYWLLFFCFDRLFKAAITNIFISRHCHVLVGPWAVQYFWIFANWQKIKENGAFKNSRLTYKQTTEQSMQQENTFELKKGTWKQKISTKSLTVRIESSWNFRVGPVNWNKRYLWLRPRLTSQRTLCISNLIDSSWYHWYYIIFAVE